MKKRILSSLLAVVLTASTVLTGVAPANTVYASEVSTVADEVTGVSVSGKVLNVEGNANIVLRDKNDSSKQYTAVSGEDGTYTIADVPAGTYQAIAYETNDYESSAVVQTVTVADSAVNDVNLQFPVDMTDKMVNPGFVNSKHDMTGWSNSLEQAAGDAGFRTDKPKTDWHGGYYFAPWASSAYEMDIYQTVEDLENGTYVVSCYAAAAWGEGGAASLYAKNAAGEVISSEVIPSNSSSKETIWQKIGLVAEVTDGTLTVGVAGNAAANGWGNVDYFNIGLLEKNSVSGKVLDAFGAVKANANVVLRDKNDSSKKYTAVSGEDGTYAFADVPAGTYQATAYETNFYDSSAVVQTVTVTAGPVKNVDLQFPVDMTSLMVNPGFVDSKHDMTGWSNSLGQSGGNAGFRSDKKADWGGYSFAPWANSAYEMDIYQTVTDLENGTYVVSCSAIANWMDGGSASLYAKNAAGEVISSEEIPSYEADWQKIGLTAEVTDGTLTIGVAGSVATAGGWGNIDNFNLGLIEKVEEPGEPEDPVIPELPPVEADIVNDSFWQDTEGNTIFSQGGGIFEFNDTYYWYGVKYQEAEWYAADPSKYYNNSKPSPKFAGVTCYSSKDLVNWKFENMVVLPEEVTKHEDMEGADVEWVGRLGVAYMEDSQTYALFVQHECADPDNSLDGDSDGTSKQVLVLTSDSPTGEFKWHQRINMKSYTGGTPNTGDQTVFTDDNGKDYLVYSYGSGRGTIFLSEIIEKDGLVTLDNSYKVYKGAGREGNCMFKYNGKYYVCASDLYGWNASHAYYIVLDSLDPEYLATLNASPIGKMETMDGCSDDFCHVTQTGFFYTVNGTEQDTVIFCGDRWSDFAGNGLGFNQWCPLSFDENGKPYYNSLSAWDLDAETGKWTVAEGNNYAKNGSFDADRVGQTVLAGWKNTITKGAAPINNVGDTATGKYALKLGENVDFAAKVSQKIADTPYVELPDGTYNLRAKVKTGGKFNTLNMYAKCGNLTSQKAITKSYTTYTTVALDGVVVSGGSVEIGFEAEGKSGAYCYVDDVTFTLAAGEVAETGSITGKLVSNTAKEVTITATAENGNAYVCTVAGDAESFTIAPVIPGTYTVEVTAHACEITNGSQEVTVVAGEAAGMADITLVNQAGDATGKVVDETGAALAGVTVTLSQEGGETVVATTAANGTYNLEDVKIGTYAISFTKRGYAVAEDAVATVEIKLGEKVTIADVSMEKVTGDAAGVLTDEEGNPVSGAVVTYYFNEDSSVKYTATTDEAGAYRIEGLVEGSYMAVATTITNPDDAWKEFNAGNNVTIKSKEVANGDLHFAEDMTDKIVNPTFNNEKDLTGWMNGSTSTGGYRTGKANTHGTFSLAPWSSNAFDMDTYQTITGLENGKYIVTCWASTNYSSAERLDFYAKDSAGNDLARVAVPFTETYRTVILIADVVDETITIGIDGHFEANTWANLDDFHLGLLELKETTLEEEVVKLDKVLGEAAAFAKDNYTDESWNALAAAIDTANALKADPNASKEDITAARKAITKAIEGLKDRPVDKTALNAAIAEVEALVEADYTADTWETLQAALKTAKSEAKKSRATQESVNNALADLVAAKDALVKVSIPGGNTTTPVVEETKITLNASKIDMGVKEKKVKLVATVTGAAADKAVTWKSDKTTIVKVKNGVLTAGKKTGKAKITVTTADGKTATCTVTVKKAPKKVTLNAKKKTLKVGKTFKVKVKKYSPKNAASYTLKFTSSNKKVASVDPTSGVVTAKKKGTAKITVKTFNGKKATVTIKVKK